MRDPGATHIIIINIKKRFKTLCFVFVSLPCSFWALVLRATVDSTDLAVDSGSRRIPQPLFLFFFFTRMLFSFSKRRRRKRTSIMRELTVFFFFFPSPSTPLVGRKKGGGGRRRETDCPAGLSVLFQAKRRQDGGWRYCRSPQLYSIYIYIYIYSLVVFCMQGRQRQQEMCVL